MKKLLAIFALSATVSVAADPIRLMFNPQGVKIASSTSTNSIPYTTIVSNGVLTVQVPLTNATASACVGMLIVLP